MDGRRTFVVGDLHLTRHSPAELADDVARLFERVAGQRVIVAGDFFDLVTDAPRAERTEAIRGVLHAHPAVRGALGRFLDGGGSLVFAGGNHDANMGQNDVRPALLDAIGPAPGAAARLTATPWFLREADVHIEHGHFYDPDNAPAHPLVIGQPSLGVHFSAEFINPTGAHRYLQANDSTPLALFLASFRWYGKRAPYVIYRYFYAALGALSQAGPFYRAHGEREAGEARQARFAEEAGVPPAMVEALLAVGAPSTLKSWAATFARLYMDRVAASLLVGGGLGAALLGNKKLAAAGASLGAALMAISWLHGHNRYRGNVVDHLAKAAQRIADEAGAKLVVFGHTHREALGDRYANTGSFAFPGPAPGRPYLEIVRGAGGPRALRHYL